MALVPFRELMAEAERGGYAVGYFESWSMESLLAVADAAEAVRSPVLLGFSGIYLPHPDRARPDPLSAYAALGRDVCAALSVPAALVYNESPDLDSVLAAVDLGFGLVMYSDEFLPPHVLEGRVRSVVEHAHRYGAAVEGETAPLPGLRGKLESRPAGLQLSDPVSAREFVDVTQLDAFAVNIGQMHLHGRQEVHLDFDRLRALKETLSVPLVLHGATSVSKPDLVEAIRSGIRKVNVGSKLKQVYFNALQAACGSAGVDPNPYEVIGSGLPSDVLIQARIALQETVEEMMVILGSSGKAWSGDP